MRCVPRFLPNAAARSRMDQRAVGNAQAHQLLLHLAPQTDNGEPRALAAMHDQASVALEDVAVQVPRGVNATGNQCIEQGATRQAPVLQTDAHADSARRSLLTDEQKPPPGHAYSPVSGSSSVHQ